MTVIAWDGKTLAADKLSTNGSTKGTTTKIFTHGNELLGVTGDLSIGLEVRDWYVAGAVPKDYPTGNREPGRGSSLIVVKPDRSVWKYESSPVPFRVEDARCAFGSGDESAKVAMHCGKTAVEAVQIASLFNTGCGGGVDSLVLPSSSWSDMEYVR